MEGEVCLFEVSLLVQESLWYHQFGLLQVALANLCCKADIEGWMQVLANLATKLIGQLC